MKVLIAEDEVVVRLLVADLLREGGFQVFEAADAGEAICILRSMAVDVVVTDLRMRTADDGVELAYYVRDHCPHTRIVAASAYLPGVDQTRAFDAFFLKPYRPEDIGAWMKANVSTSPSEDDGLKQAG